jgi:rhodanese-related sulfurtransferase
MRKVILIAVITLLSAAVAGAQMKVPTKSAGSQRLPLSANGARVNTASSFQRISMADAKKLYEKDQAVFIDVRSNEQFTYGHIKGALSIPGSQIVRRFHEVTPGKTVITYCACSAEQSSGRAAASLVAHGVKNVFALKGGWAEWKDSKLPIAAGPK